jgi:hypothetical protein
MVSKQVIDREASVSEVEVPDTYQTVSRQVIDIDALRAKGYKFSDAGDIVATPTGERVLRAADVMRGNGAEKSAGAASGEEGYVREIVVPAEYATVKKQVIDQPATVREVEVPATYKTVSRRVVKTPATTEEVVIPAAYKTVSREVIDQQASSREIKGPAQYKTVMRQVVDTPPSTREIPVPAVTRAMTHQVIDTPASTREEIVPAEYQTVTRQVIDQPATTHEVDVGPVYETLSRQVKVADATAEWRSILCETNATPAKLRHIQRALAAAGFDPGPIDGVVHKQTMRAVNEFQTSKGLPVDAYLNIETVKALGVDPIN